MTEHDKISSDVEATAGSEQVAVPSRGRRRLVKGIILATPAIVTIRNGFARPNSAPPTQEEACASFLNNGGINAPGFQSFLVQNPGFNPDTNCATPPK